MERRFNNKNLSAPYFKSLGLVIMRQSIFHSERKRDQVELENDHLFLEDFILVTLANDDFVGLDIPEIIKAATNLHLGDKIFDLYTNETSQEFHKLLLYLLQNFQTTLVQLIAWCDSDTKKATTKDTTSDSKNTFSKSIHKVHIYGYALLRLSRGRAFQLHLENIEPLLKEILDLGDEEEDHIEEYDGELEEIRLTLPQNGDLPKLYTAWLRLMVAHFDATEIVVRALDKLQFEKVSVTILVPPKPDGKLLKWRELFSHQYLPNINPGSDRDIPSHNDILVFLEAGVSRAEAANRQYELAENALKGWNTPGDRSEVISTLQLAIDPDAQVKDIITKIKTWQTMHRQTTASEKKYRTELSKDISSSIKKLKDAFLQQRDRDFFFSNLEKMSFSGTVHCEACLASLLPSFTKDFLSDNNYKEMNVLSDLQVEYSHFSLLLSSDPHFFFLCTRAMSKLLECQNIVAHVVQHFSGS